MKSLSFGSLILSIIVGTALVIGFAYITGDFYATALFPSLAILSAFIISGFIIGIMSKDVTIAEPGIGAVVVAILSYLIVPAMELKGLALVTTSDWILIFINGIVLTFLGAWLGEKIQHGALPTADESDFDWGWGIAGTILGVTLNIVLVIILTLIMGANPSKFYIPFFLSLFIVGIVIGRFSPGITIKEAGLAGLLIIAVDFDIIRLTLYSESIPLSYIIGGMLIGIIVTWIGGFIGEKMQASKEAKVAKAET